MARHKISREELKSGEVLCEHCSAKCCRYFALPIDTPTEIEDFQHLRWYLLHGDCAVFVEDDTWYLLVYGDCKHLTTDPLCDVYEHRPTVCREYGTDNCEYDDDACYDKFFECAEQVWEYAEAVLSPEEWNRAFPDGGREVSLPVLTAQ